MRRWMMPVLLAVALVLGGCAGQRSDKPKDAGRTLCLYSELDNKFTAALVQSFNNDNKEKLQVSFISELKPGAPLPDVVLTERRTLYGFKEQRRLARAELADGARLPAKLRDEDGQWFGLFYDPVVFLVNQQFAREIGQRSLRGWNDLENHGRLRLAMENLSDSGSTQGFLGALADGMGETGSLNYLWNINRFVGQYAKFPFTPVRLAAVGDADVAITRQSYVFKYLESKFPAYVVQPQEGTPVNLYGMAMLNSSERKQEALLFMEWLLRSEKLQAVAQAENTGYMFIFPRGIDEAPVDADKLWLNKNYLQTAKLDDLVNRWIARVRFSK